MHPLFSRKFYLEIPLRRREFTTASLGFAATLFGLPASVRAAETASILRDRALDFAPVEQRRLAGLIERGVLEIQRVLAIPEDEPCRHLGWPVATMLPSGRVVVVFQRGSGHTDHDDRKGAGTYVIFSDDLQHWHPRHPLRLGPTDGMNCVAGTGGGGVIAISSGNPRRVDRSENEAAEWKTDEHAFDGMLDGAVQCGPNLIRHPSFGLVASFGQKQGGQTGYLVHSLDHGRTWKEHHWINRVPGARSVEPALATWGKGHMVMIGREKSAAFAVGPDGLYGHTQHVYTHRPGNRFDQVEFDTTRTNIVGNPAAGYASNDTAEVIFNPVSQRIEVLQAHRYGGGLGNTMQTFPKNEAEEVSSLNLWTIEPSDLLQGSGTWRFDGTILERVGFSRKANKDGLHPGSSVVDVARGVQHIFIYAGWRRSPSNLYRITRTLDTDRWLSAVKHARS